MKRLLFISHRLPFPPDKGERVRAYQEIRALSKSFEVTVAALAHSDEDYKAAEQLEMEGCRVLLARGGGKLGLARGAWRLLRGGSVTEGYFSSRFMHNLLKRERLHASFDIVLAYCSSMLQFAMAVPASVRVVDMVDADSAKWETYAKTVHWALKPLYQLEARAIRRLELGAIERCDAVAIVSQAEARALHSGSSKVTVVGNGVDTEYFSPSEAPPEGETSIVFTGTMDYWPNVAGVCWFVRQVWPEIKKRRPEATFIIVGRNPVRSVRKLSRVSGVQVTGSVPDVRPYLAAAGVVVCPLKFAPGVQNKILEAMAMGRAVIASPAALSGLDVEVGKDLLQADAKVQWQEQIVQILTDQDHREQMGRDARSCVEVKYTWPGQMRSFVSLCTSLVEATNQKGSPKPKSEQAGTTAKWTWAKRSCNLF